MNRDIPTRLGSLFLTLLLTMGLVLVAAPAQAAVAFTVTPLTWDVVGLDSNNVTVGPNVYEVGVRGCNTGSTNATTTIATLTWNSANIYINMQPGTSDIQVVRNLGPGVCFDYYFNVEITRNAAAYFTTRQFQISLQDCPSNTIIAGSNPDGTCSVAATATANNGTTHQIYVEKIVSQNRNYVSASASCSICGIYGSLSDPDGPGGATPPVTTPATTNVQVGSTYTYVLIATTAPGGFGSWSAQLNFSRGIFQIQAEKTELQTYPNPANAFCCQDDANVYTTANDGLGPNGTIYRMWANACGFDQDRLSANYRSCATTNPPKLDKAGDLVYLTYTIKILKAGTGSLTGVVWDGSGSSYHYNSDYGVQTLAVTATSPTEATFETATAHSTPDGDLVSWSTGHETDNLGFNIYGRSPAGNEVKANDALIAGSALSAGGDASDGRDYRWLVPTGRASGPYRIEAVDLDGGTHSFGPFSVSGSANAAARSSATLDDLGGSAGPSGLAPRVAHPAPLTSYAPSQAAAVEVDHEGLYDVPLSELAALGVDTSVPRKLHVTAEGTEQSVQVAGGSLRFYGLGSDTEQTAIRTYVVSKRSTQAPEIETSNASGGQHAGSSSLATATREDNSIYFSSLLNGRHDNFFGSPVTASSSDQTVEVSAPARNKGKLDVALQGVTEGPHQVAVSINGDPVGHVAFAGKKAGVLSAKGVDIQAGTNTVTLQSSGALDVSLTDHISITYPRLREATDDVLQTTVPSRQRATLTGFTSEDITVLDVTDPDAPIALSPTVSPSGGGFEASVTVPAGGTRTLYAAAGAQVPKGSRTMDDGGLASASNAADMLIITNDALAPVFADLEDFHDQDGLKTRIVNIQDVYDAFGGGEPSTAALRSFLSYADRNWHRGPSFILLGGDASLDPRGYLGPDGPQANVVPTEFVDTRFMETASDPWLIKADDVALGRMPVSTPDEASALIDKTIAYASSPKNKAFVMASDEADPGFDFEAASDDVAARAPSGTQVTTINRAAPNAREDLLAAINDGPSVLNYLGHGNITFWRGDTFTTDDTPDLTNTEHPAFFVAMTCLNGYFVDPQLPSLAESMLSADGGAVVAWASTGQTFPRPQVRMNKALYVSLDHADTIGQATREASGSIRDKDVRATWALLGDPALELR